MFIYQIELVEYVVNIYCDEDNQIANKTLNESKWITKGSYKIRLDKSLGQGQDHIHIYLRRGGQLASMNYDGSGHDGYHDFRLPNKVVDVLSRIPGIIIPPNGITESLHSIPNELDDEIKRRIEMLVKYLIPYNKG